MPCALSAVLLEYTPAHGDVFDLVETLRAGRGLDLPLILVTGEGSEKIAARAMRLGIDDYLVKQPGWLHRLPGVIESQCHRVELLHERAALRDSEARFRLQARRRDHGAQRTGQGLHLPRHPPHHPARERA